MAQTGPRSEQPTSDISLPSVDFGVFRLPDQRPTPIEWFVLRYGAGHEAENAAGFAKGIGAIKFDLNRRHSSLANVAWDPNGLVHSYDEYKQKFGRP